MAVKKIPEGGRSQLDPIEAAKRKLFLIATPAGVLVSLVVWVIGLSRTAFSVQTIFILPFLALIFLPLVGLLWRNYIRLRTFELTLFVLVMAFGIFEFVMLLLSAIWNKASFNTDFTIWLPFIYILSFLIFSAKRALQVTLIYFLATLLLGLAAGLICLLKGLVFPNSYLFMQVYFASTFYIAVFYLVALIKDRYISESAIAIDLTKLAATDALTQLDNRRVLTQYLKEEVNRAARYHQPLSVMLFDLDKFKRINDNYGHNTGDEVLQVVARQLKQNVRVSDAFGRWGGDEFLCLATNTDIDQAVELADRLRESLKQCKLELVDQITASFGVTAYQKGDSPETLIRRADLGLYKAKANGRDRVEAVLAGVTLPIFEGERPVPLREDEGD